MPEAVTFHWRTGRVRLIAAGVAIIAALGLVLLFQDEVGAKALGLGWFAVFAALGTAFFRRARGIDPVVVIDAHGIFDKRLSADVIPWSDISSVETLEAENVTFVGIDLKPGAAIYARLNVLHRMMRWPNRLLRFPALSIAMHALDGNAADVLAAVARFRPDLIRES